MTPDDIESARKDLLQWSPPIIADVVTDAYTAELSASHVSVRVLGAMHARLWRFMLRGELEKLAEARKDLSDMTRLAGLDTGHIDAIDQIVLEELLDVVTSRFARSPDRARVYSRILLKATVDLTEMRLAAV